MPYTVSHAIIALPVARLSKGQIPLAAIVIGSVSPDFPYFLAMSPTHAPGHTLAGVLLYCLLPSLLITHIWFSWIEKPTLEFWMLPYRKDHHQNKSVLLVSVGILIGAYSHVLWDATSHSYGAIVEQSNILQYEIFNRPIYKWNQYLSGVFGLAALMFWYLFALYKNINAIYKGKFPLGVSIYVLSIMFFIVIGMFYRQPNSLVDVVVTSSITVVNGFVLGACIYAIWIKVAQDR